MTKDEQRDCKDYHEAHKHELVFFKDNKMERRNDAIESRMQKQEELKACISQPSCQNLVGKRKEFGDLS